MSIISYEAFEFNFMRSIYNKLSQPVTAYEIWKAAGNTGTEAEFLESIKGDKGDKGDTGEQGTQGPSGEKGATGIRGSRWSSGKAITGTATAATVFSGSGITDALINDMYLNADTGNIYKCTVAGNASTAKWVYVGVIKGPAGTKGDKGDQGEQGTQGPSGEKGLRGSRWTPGTAITGTATAATVFSGSGITDSLVDDMYLNINTGNIYKCTTAGNASVAKWSFVGNIKGANGTAGAKGDTGADGKQGEQGYGILVSIQKDTFTEAQWETYGTAGHIETWSDTSSSRNGCRIGDLFVIMGTSTDSKNGHILLYKAGNASGDLSGTCLSHSIAYRGATGEKGAVGSKGETGTRGTKWFSGAIITGTATDGTVFSESGVTDALVDDMYLNTDTGYVYKCTTAGAADLAKWSYVGSIKGPSGDTSSIEISPEDSVKAYLTGTPNEGSSGSQIYDPDVYLTEVPGRVHYGSVEVGNALLQYDEEQDALKITFNN